MTVTTVASSTFLSDSTIFLRDKLLTNITDPIASTRPAREKFVMTSYPERAVTYPVITIKNLNFSTPRRLGIQSELHFMTIEVEVRIWARNVKERDELTQSVISHLQSTELDASSTRDANLYGFRVTSAVNVEEPGEAGIHSKVLNIEYNFILGA